MSDMINSINTMSLLSAISHENALPHMAQSFIRVSHKTGSGYTNTIFILTAPNHETDIPTVQHHIPYTIYHIPFTIYHIPHTIYHIPYTIYHIPYTIHGAAASSFLGYFMLTYCELSWYIGTKST